MLSVIWPERATDEVLSAGEPVLFVFLKKDNRFPEQVKILEALSRKYLEKIKICLADEYYLKPLSRQFNVSGIPVYLFLEKGMEKSRFLGRAGRRELEAFISSNLNKPGSRAKPERAQ